MNKFKHVTPTNIAPLGKRHNNLTTLIKKEEHQQQQQHQQKAVIITHETKPLPSDLHQQSQSFQLHHQLQSQSIPSSSLNTITHTISSQNHHSHQHTHQQPTTVTSIGQQMWTCELCNRILPTREEWTAHAKAHMEV
jgi:hypothetical protein